MNVALDAVDLSVAEQVAVFATYLQVEKGCRPGTIRAYTREVRLWLEFLAGHEATAEQVRLHLLTLKGSASTVTRRLSALKAWGRSVRAKAFLAELEEIERPKRPKGLPKPIPDWRARIVSFSPEYRARFVFLVLTGLRISEACAVNESLPIGTELTVNGKGGKDRIVPLMPEAAEALTFLGGRMGVRPRAIQRYFRRHADVNPHRCRHERATSLIRSGGDIGDVRVLLGHASVATSQIYSEFGTDRVREAMERAS